MSRVKNGDMTKKIAVIAIMAALAYVLFGEIGVGILAIVLMLMA